MFSRTWVGKARLINGWGPAETCVFSTLHEWKSPDESPLTIGRPVGGHCWIVDPEDPHKLAPIGTLGEVVIQGPTILREYLADPERTNLAMVRSVPKWARNHDSSSPYWGQFYKSGDLCRYNPDGTMEFATRKDTQIKIRGLRVELGEVQHHIQESLKDVRQAAVDVHHSEAGANLIAYICFSDEMRPSTMDDDTLFLPLNDELKTRLTTVVSELSIKLPRYMVPTRFIPCSYMPSITSTKLDRKELKRLTAGLSKQQMNSYGLLESKKRAPKTQAERKLQAVWADLLKISLESIGRDDSFLGLGGDSISAIHMVSASRKAGILVTVKDIFNDPRLSAVASVATEITSDIEEDLTILPPFSLLSEPLRLAVCGDKARDMCQLAAHQVVEDAYPCTKFSRGLDGFVRQTTWVLCHEICL